MPQEDFIQVKTAVYAFHRAYEIVLGSSARSVFSKKGNRYCSQALGWDEGVEGLAQRDEAPWLIPTIQTFTELARQ